MAKKPLKLSGLLNGGTIPKADVRVVDRMAQPTPVGQLVAQAASVPSVVEHPFGPPDANAPDGAGGELLELSVSLIDRSPYQPRVKLDQEHIESLAESISTVEMIEPIIVREKEGGRYELIAGEHRLEAVRLLGLTHIAAMVRTMSDAQAQIVTLVDNLRRKDMSDYEAGKRFKEIVASAAGEEKISVTTLAKQAGVTRQYIYRAIALASLPEAILRFLEEDPYLIGGNAGDDLRELCSGGNEQLAIQAVEMVRNKKLLQSKIMAWAMARLSAKAAPGATRTRVQCADSRISAAVKASGNGLMVALEYGKKLSPEEAGKLRGKVETWLKEVDLS